MSDVRHIEKQPEAAFAYDVWLLGAGPGDPGLLTLRAAEVLAEADVVVHDRLGCEEILSSFALNARRIDVGKAPGRVPVSQDEIHRILESEARAGFRVARLKGGDPFVFGRGMEEIEYLAARGIRCRVVPGVSSALAGPGAAGIPITHRGLAAGFSVYTARMGGGAVATVRAGETAVFLMAIEAMDRIVAQLIEQGLSPETPAAVVSNATTYRQESVAGTLANIESRAAGLPAPAVLVVGKTAAYYRETPAPNAVVVTSSRIPPKLKSMRPESHLLARPLANTRLAEASDRELAISELRAGIAADWVVFNSPLAVSYTFDMLKEANLDVRQMRGRIVAIGSEAAREIEARGMIPELVVVDGRRNRTAETLAPSIEGKSVLLPLGSEYGGRLDAALRLSGAAVVRTPRVYRSIRCDAAPVDWRFVGEVFFASPRSVERFVGAYPEAPVAELTALCVGESVCRAALEAGFATPIDLSGLAAAPSPLTYSEVYADGSPA